MGLWGLGLGIRHVSGTQITGKRR